jgi:hypothetical protein
MKSRGSKIKLFGWLTRGALAIGVTLSLIASPQAWAGTACLCESQFGRQHSRCQEAHHRDTTVKMQGENTASEPSSSCSCEPSTQATGVAQVPFQSSPGTVCCALKPQSEPPASFVQMPSQVGAAPVQSADCLLWPTASGPAHTFNLIRRYSKRPLYLAFSCLLI